jgi:predicted transcriptional regulator
MSPNPIFLSHRRSFDDAVQTMRELGVRRLPIVDDDARVIGLVSLDDILMQVAAQLDALGRAVQRELGPPLPA